MKKEAGIQPAAKRQRVSFDDDDVRIVDIVRAEPIELDDSNDSANSDQVRFLKNQFRIMSQRRSVSESRADDFLEREIIKCGFF